MKTIFMVVIQSIEGVRQLFPSYRLCLLLEQNGAKTVTVIFDIEKVWVLWNHSPHRVDWFVWHEIEVSRLKSSRSSDCSGWTDDQPVNAMALKARRSKARQISESRLFYCIAYFSLQMFSETHFDTLFSCNVGNVWLSHHVDTKPNSNHSQNITHQVTTTQTV